MSELVQGLADTVRAVFGARATSVLVLDEATQELVFEAVSGEGADVMPGRRVPAAAGIAGWVVTAGQPLVVEDVASDPRFAADFARSTGYVPRGIMAAPLLGEDGPVGVVQVLDRPRRAEFTLIEVELLERFCHLVVLARTGAVSAPVSAPVADLAAAVAALPGRRRAAAERLLDALTAVLEA